MKHYNVQSIYLTMSNRSAITSKRHSLLNTIRTGLNQFE